MSRIKKAVRPTINVKVLMNAPSGAGKTYTALRLAKGLRDEMIKDTGDDNIKIGFIGTESQRDLLYADEFDYDIIQLSSENPDEDSDFSPEAYIEAIDDFIEAGYKILIVDSISHEWNGAGGMLEIHSKIPGNTYTAWNKCTPRHNDFLDALIESPIHLIATVKAKDEVVIEDVNGKKVPKKIGVGYYQRDALEYLFMTSFLLDKDTHIASEFKDNTHLFENKPRMLSEKDGALLYNWAVSGSDEEIVKKANEISSSKEIGKKIMEETSEKTVDKKEDKKTEKKSSRNRRDKKKPDEIAEETVVEPSEPQEIEKKDIDVKKEPKTQKELYNDFKALFKKGKENGLKLADVKEIIKDCGETTIKSTTDIEVIMNAIELLEAKLK